MGKMDLNEVLGDWEAAGYSEEQATRCVERVIALLNDPFDAVVAQAKRDFPPDQPPPATTRGTRDCGGLFRSCDACKQTDGHARVCPIGGVL
jgi:hypothetical protein